MQYSAEVGGFVTKSLHFFENDELRSAGCVLGSQDSMKPQLHLDPEGRIAAVRVFSSHLSLIPLVKANGDEFDHGEGARLDSLRSQVLSFSKNIDPRLKNVRSIEFLPGFLNPTLAVLYDRGSNCEQENVVARSAVNQSFNAHPKETCALMIIAIEPVKFSAKLRHSLDFQFTVINNIENIPWDCSALFPLPKPVGGLLLITSNMLLWCDISSSAAPHCIPVNLFAALTYSGRVSISTLASFGIASLRDCQMAPIDIRGDMLKILLITVPGEQFLLSISRSGRTLGYFNVEPIKGQIPLTPCPAAIVSLKENMLFLATESGNCNLVKVSLGSLRDASSVEKEQGSKPHGVSKNEASATSKNGMDDIDAYLYGEEAVATGPARGSTKATTDADYLASLEKEEATMQKSASTSDCYTFSVIDEIECLGPVIDMAVGCSDAGSFELVTIGGNISTSESGVNRQYVHGTINVITQQVPVQVTANFSLPDTKRIWSVINNVNGSTKFLIASTSTSTLVLATSEAKIDEVEESAFFLEGPTLFCGTACADDGSAFILQLDAVSMRILDFNGEKMISRLEHNMTMIKKVSCYRGGFIILLADGSLREFLIDSAGQISERPTNLSGVAAFAIYQEKLLFLVTEKGAFGLFTVHDRTILFENPAFNRLPSALFNRLGQPLAVSELNQRIVALDVLNSAAGDGECFLLVRFETESEKKKRLLSCCYYRFDLKMFSLCRVYSNILGKLPSGSQLVDSVCLQTNEVLLFSPTLSTGSFVLAGVSDRNFPRHHRLSIKGDIASVAPYNQSSLLVLKDDGSILIVDVQKYRSRLNLDWNSELVLRRLRLPRLDRVPVYICFHPPSRTYLVASAPLTSDFKLPADEYAPISDNQNFATVNGTETAPKMYAAQSSALHLLNPIAWSFVDEASDLFLPYETVTCMKTLELATQQTTTGFHPFIVVGTAYQKSEDRPIRGRGIVFDVAEVIPEVGRPETNRKLRLKGISEFKGPVFTMSPLLDGNVAISLGQKIVIHAFEEDEKFAGVAFHDIGTCSLALASLKNFFVAADLTKSVAFLAYQAEPLARVHALGRDYGQNLQCSAVEFLVNSEGQVMIVAADDQGGLHFFAYAPASKF